MLLLCIEAVCSHLSKEIKLINIELNVDMLNICMVVLVKLLCLL